MSKVILPRGLAVIVIGWKLNKKYEVNKSEKNFDSVLSKENS